MNEFEELVKQPGVLMAGQLSPDGRVAEHKETGLYFAQPDGMQMAAWFCSAITQMLATMGATLTQVYHGGADTTSWLPVRSWMFFGGDYAIAVVGERFVFAESAKIDSLDKLRELVREPGA
jgi:roadblock/LC7 domain-containing protein